MSKIKEAYKELEERNDMNMFLEKIRKYCTIKLHNTTFAGMDKEDVIQEILLKVYSVVNNYDLSKGSITTYLDKIIDNKVKDCLRHASSHTNLVNTNAQSLDIVANYEDQKTSKSFNIDLRADDSAYSCREYVLDILDRVKLTNKESEVLKLHLTGYSFIEIAKHSGCSKSRISHIWKNIRGKLELLIAS